MWFFALPVKVEAFTATYGNFEFRTCGAAMLKRYKGVADWWWPITELSWLGFPVGFYRMMITYRFTTVITHSHVRLVFGGGGVPQVFAVDAWFVSQFDCITIIHESRHVKANSVLGFRHLSRPLRLFFTRFFSFFLFFRGTTEHADRVVAGHPSQWWAMHAYYRVEFEYCYACMVTN